MAIHADLYRSCNHCESFGNPFDEKGQIVIADSCCDDVERTRNAYKRRAITVHPRAFCKCQYGRPPSTEQKLHLDYRRKYRFCHPVAKPNRRSLDYPAHRLFHITTLDPKRPSHSTRGDERQVGSALLSVHLLIHGDFGLRYDLALKRGAITTQNNLRDFRRDTDTTGHTGPEPGSRVHIHLSAFIGSIQSVNETTVK